MKTLVPGILLFVAFMAILSYSGNSCSYTPEEPEKDPFEITDQDYIDEMEANEAAQQEEADEMEAYANDAEYERERRESIEATGAIPWEEAKNHIGEYVTLYGIAVNISRPGIKGDPIYVDMGGAYPNDRVTGVCWKEHHSQFKDLEKYEHEEIFMEGTLYEYDGTPNIELTDSFQIRAID